MSVLGLPNNARHPEIFPSTHIITPRPCNSPKKYITELLKNYLNWCTLFQKINIKNDPKRRTVQCMHTVKVESKFSVICT